MSIFTRALEGPLFLNDCDFSVHTLEEGMSGAFTYYERMRSYVQHEDGLINSRLTWSLTIHGFLFVLFGTLGSKAIDLITAEKSLPIVSGLLIAEMAIALIGALVGYFSREAIVAAHNALQHLFTIAHEQGVLQLSRPSTTVPVSKDSVLLPKIVSGGSNNKNTAGASRYYVHLPEVMMVAWSLLALCSGYVLYAAHYCPQSLR